MKYILSKLLNIFRVSKTINLSNDDKINTLREEVAGVFSQFKSMRDTLTKVNEKLEEVIEEEKNEQAIEQEILDKLIENVNQSKEESDNRVEKALLEIEANKKLQEKVKEFII